MGFDTVDKVRLLRAIADTAINCAGGAGEAGVAGGAGERGEGWRGGGGGEVGAAVGPTVQSKPALGSGRCWITEMNWPLREGPHWAGRRSSNGCGPR